MHSIKNYRYPGTQPFSNDQKSIFFGRDKDIDQLHNLILMEKVSLLFSKSGLGKSSLVNAGLIPKLAETNEILPIPFRFGTFRPTQKSKSQDTSQNGASLLSIAKATLQNKLNVIPKNFLNQIDPNDDSLWYLLKSNQIETGQNQILFIFDQFEEFFSYPKEDIKIFLKEISEVLYTKIPQRYRDKSFHLYQKHKSSKNKTKLSNSPHEVSETTIHNINEVDQEKNILETSLNIKILFVIREDKISLLKRISKYFPNLINHSFQIQALDSRQTEDAILYPAFQKNRNFISKVFDIEDEAIEFITAYLTNNNEERAEPFQLQTLCQSIEQKVIDQKLTRITKNDIENIDKVYEKYYDVQLNKISNPEQKIKARTIIESGLIDEKEGRRMTLYMQQMINTFQVDENLIEQLINTRLIRAVDDSRGGTFYELCHDSMIAPILKSKREREKNNKELEITKAKNDVKAAKGEITNERKKRIKWQSLTIGLLAISLIGIISYSMQQGKTLTEQNKVLELNGLKIIKIQDQNKLTDQNLKVSNLTGAAIVQAKSDRTIALNLLNNALEITPNNKVTLNVRNSLINNKLRFPFYKKSFSNHPDHIRNVFIRNNTEQIITATGESIFIWEKSKNYKNPKIIHSNFGLIKTLDISNSNDLLIQTQKYISIKELSTSEKQIIEINTKGAIFTDVKFVKNNAIVTSDSKGNFSLWTKKGQKIASKKYKSITCLIVSEDKSKYLVGHKNGWSQGQIKANGFNEQKTQTTTRITAASFLNSEKLITGNIKGIIKIWGNNLNLKLSIAAHDGEIKKIICAKDYFISASQDHTIKIWSYDGRILKTLLGHSSTVEALSFDVNNKLLISGSQDRTAKLWDLNSNSKIGKKIHNSNIYSIDVSKDGKNILTGSWGAQVKEVKFDGNETTVNHCSSCRVRSVKYFNNNEYFDYASGGGESIKCWKDGILHNKLYMKSDIFDLEIIRNGKYILGVGGGDLSGVMKLWKVDTTRKRKNSIKPIKVYSGYHNDTLGHQSRINDLALSPNKSRIVTASDDQSIIIWDTSGTIIKKIVEHTSDKVKAVIYSPDGKFFFSAGWDDQIHKWDSEGNFKKSFYGHNSDINNLAILRDSLLVSIGSDKKVLIWDFDGNQQPNYMGTEKAIYGLAISPDNKSIITGERDGTLKIWDYKTINEIMTDIEVIPKEEFKKYGIDLTKE